MGWSSTWGPRGTIWSSAEASFAPLLPRVASHEREEPGQSNMQHVVVWEGAIEILVEAADNQAATTAIQHTGSLQVGILSMRIIRTDMTPHTV